MTTKSIRNIKEGTWREFKAIASMRNMTLAEAFEEMVEKTKKKSVDWNYFTSLKDKPLISEPDKLHKHVNGFRKNFKLR